MKEYSERGICRMKVHGYLISFEAIDKDHDNVTANFVTQRKSKIKTRNIRLIEKNINRDYGFTNVVITNICYLGEEEE